MERYTKVLVLLSTFILLFGLTACQRKNGVTEPISSSEPGTVPETTDAESTEFTVDPNMEVRREPADISLYPFASEELSSAQDVVQKYLDSVSKEPGVLTYQVERIAFDPITTDVHVRQGMISVPMDGWVENDYYERQISFAITYSATYDHQKSPAQDAIHNVISINLHRENAQSPWEFWDSGAAEEGYAAKAMTDQELANITAVKGRILAGYAVDGEYWLYVWDEEACKVMFLQQAGHYETMPPETTEPISTDPAPSETDFTEPDSLAVWDESAYQVGSPVTPQPGDTEDSWNPSLAADYPADSDCSDMELLEKWMAVEGLTMEDLDNRGCSQLVLVAAREPDGVQTFTTCYQKQTDGTWEPVSGLTRMEGWTGSNGIMHGRRRNTVTSPAGLWSLGLAFGNSEKPEGLKMPWRDVTPNTDWVCDEDSIYFNTWQERDDPNLLETWSDDVEHLEDYPNSYAYACVIRFNTSPYTIPNRGCAIFFHCAKGPTGGCIGLPEANMIDTLLWMDPEQNPYILITGYQKDTA